MSTKINGVAIVDGEIRNMVELVSGGLSSNVKEIIYASIFNEVESLIGFEDLELLEVDEEDEVVKAAKLELLTKGSDVKAIIFIDGGFLMITDLIYFAGYVQANGVKEPYMTSIETNTYEDDEAQEILEEDTRLR